MISRYSLFTCLRFIEVQARVIKIVVIEFYLQLQFAVMRPVLKLNAGRLFMTYSLIFAYFSTSKGISFPRFGTDLILRTRNRSCSWKAQKDERLHETFELIICCLLLLLEPPYSYTSHNNLVQRIWSMLISHHFHPFDN